MPKISVIIPVYNAEKYLERCLNSVINQTLKEIEIICVDDCSNDKSLEILNRYAKKDKRLKVIHCDTNGGESKARNIGLDNANGEYIAFVDNDDLVDLDFYEKLYLKATETKADIVKGEAKIYDYEGNISYDSINSQIHKNHSKLFFITYWWTAIYKNELIKKENISLPEGYNLGGDALFLNKAILKCNHLELVDGVYYNYIRRKDSGDSLKLSQDKIKSVLSIIENIIHNILDYQTNDISGKKFVLEWCLQSTLYYAYRLNTIENIKYCISKACDYYQKTAEIIADDENFLPIVMKYLKNNDKKGLAEFYINNDTQKKMQLANLRYIHLNRSKNDKNLNNHSCV